MKRIKLAAGDESTNPATYRDKVTTTSEALSYTCALLNSVVVNAGDLVWQKKNYPLFKLFTYYLDHRSINFDDFRCVAEDPELWDFIYPDLETELENSRSRNSSSV